MASIWNIPFKFSLNGNEVLSIVFPIFLPHKTVFMRHDLNHQQGYIVIADTTKFINVWRLSENDDRFSNYHKGNSEQWKSDRKFKGAEHGFSQGEKNPVPIATNIFYEINNERKNIIFSDDFTRTIWLLSNEAKYFSLVITDHEVAQTFQIDMGFQNNPIQSVASITAYAKNLHQQIFNYR